MAKKKTIKKKKIRKFTQVTGGKGYKNIFMKK